MGEEQKQMVEDSGKEFDFVIFGASGFTGQYVVEEVARTVDEEEGPLKWAVAGRSMAKVQAVLQTASKYTGKDLEDVPILIADVSSPASLTEMCQKSKLVLNCVGPYQFYGDAVVRACIANNAHHIDICGEPGFLEKCQLLYDGKARENGVYIIGACGWDSIPSEMGFIYTRNQGEVESVESFVELHHGPQGSHGNFGTWQSAVHSFANANELRRIRKQLFSERLQLKRTSTPKRGLVFKSEDLDSWAIPFVGCDKSVVMRTQRYSQQVKAQEPIQFNVYYKVPGFSSVIFYLLAGAIFGFLANWKVGRWLLEKFPAFLSLGLFSKQGPTRKQINEAAFTNTMVASVPEEQKKLITRISGPECGYASTPICFVQAAYAILEESDKLPESGGVFTPGSAFADTRLMDRLSNHNIKFEVVQQP